MTVLHAGPPSKPPEDRYIERIVSQRRLGPFHFQKWRAVQEAIQEHDVTIAMFDLCWPAYTLPVLARERPKLILWGHRYSGNRLANHARNILMKRADRLLMYGEEELSQMITSGIDPDRIDIAPNTIDVPNHADLSASAKSNLLYVGRLQDRKRIDLAIEVFARLQGRIDPTIGFDIIGSGEPLAALRECAQEHGVADKVHFHGTILDQVKLRTFFEAAIAYVSPGPVGLGVLHSFAFGVPVVTLKTGRHGPELQNIDHDRNGLIVADAQGLEDALLSLCTDPARVRALGAAAHLHYSSKRTLEHMLEGFCRTIEQA